MDDITKPSGNYMGSLSKIQVCPVELIYSIPEPLNGVISSAVTFQSGKRWYDVYSAFESLSISQKSVSSAQGKHYEISVDGFVPGHCAVLDELFNQLENSKLVLKITDMNGKIFLVCNTTRAQTIGATLTVDYDSTSSYSGKSGYQLSFKLTSPQRIYSYGPSGSGSGS